jgi:glutamyl-tRNA synthetase
MSRPVRTRFAPSPTGYLHVGGIRTALFAWLVARQNNGQFILRLEDTDQKREVEGAAQHIIDSLRALGLEYDEGPDKPGEHGPYRQSERLELYKKWAQKLLDAGRAYVDPFSQEEVQALREQDQKNKLAFLFRNHVNDKQRDNTDWDGKKPLRFKSEPKNYKWRDEVTGNMSAPAIVIDDFILMKSDGFPTYNFAHVVDDAEMKVTHVIRGGEFLASVPNYLNLYEALNIEWEQLTFATLPHIMNEQGNKKLSKRDGATDVLDYLKVGYLPEALVSFISTLGWNDGTKQEVFTVDELIEKFSLKRVQKSGARFDERRLLWANGHFIRELAIDDLYDKVADYWPSEAAQSTDDYKKQVLSLVQERLKYFSELPELTRFFFSDLPVDTSLLTTHKKLKKYNAGQLNKLLETTKSTLESIDFSSKEDIQGTLNELLEKLDEKPVVLFSLIRIAITQSPASPGLAETLQVLGRETSLKRIDSTIKAVA